MLISKEEGNIFKKLFLISRMRNKFVFLEIIVLCFSFKNFRSSMYFSSSQQEYGSKNDYVSSKIIPQYDYIPDKRKEILRFRPNMKRK